MFFLADLHCTGEFVMKSTKKAVKLYKKASALGFAAATDALSRIYLDGEGIDLDNDKGMQLWRRDTERWTNVQRAARLAGG